MESQDLRRIGEKARVVGGHSATRKPGRQISFRAVSEVPRDVQRRQQLEGKKVEVDEILPAARAYPIIEEALAAYDKKRRARHHRK